MTGDVIDLAKWGGSRFEFFWRHPYGAQVVGLASVQDRIIAICSDQSCWQIDEKGTGQQLEIS